ncbi:MAG: phosphatase PAP2 family protein, partial [Pseudomonadota bacterium]
CHIKANCIASSPMQGKENIGVLSLVSGVSRRSFNRALYLITVMGGDLTSLIFMTILLVFAVEKFNGHIRWFQASVGLPLGMMAAVLITKFIKDYAHASKNAHIILRDWLPFLLISFIYENLHDVAGHVMAHDIAPALYKWDVMLFGVEPTIWVQKLFNPLFTDVMAFSYALYFFLPLFLMFFLSVQDRRLELRQMSLCLTFVFLAGFLCYVFLPANPPRYFITDLYTSPVKLTGLFLFDRLQGAWDGLSVIKGGAFPSLHVGISSVALIYAYKFRNISRLYSLIWWSYIPLVVSLWFSTIYLRHHWVIDIFAGWLVALFGALFAGVMLGLWTRLRNMYGLSL